MYLLIHIIPAFERAMKAKKENRQQRMMEGFLGIQRLIF